MESVERSGMKGQRSGELRRLVCVGVGRRCFLCEGQTESLQGSACPVCGGCGRVRVVKFCAGPGVFGSSGDRLR